MSIFILSLCLSMNSSGGFCVSRARAGQRPLPAARQAAIQQPGGSHSNSLPLEPPPSGRLFAEFPGTGSCPPRGAARTTKRQYASLGRRQESWHRRPQPGKRGRKRAARRGIAKVGAAGISTRDQSNFSFSVRDAKLVRSCRRLTVQPSLGHISFSFPPLRKLRDFCSNSARVLVAWATNSEPPGVDCQLCLPMFKISLQVKS